MFQTVFLRNVTILSLRKRFFQWGSVIYNKGLQTTLKSLNVFRCCYFESCQNSDVVTQWNLIEGTKMFRLNHGRPKCNKHKYVAIKKNTKGFYPILYHRCFKQWTPANQCDYIKILKLVNNMCSLEMLQFFRYVRGFFSEDQLYITRDFRQHWNP
jgi:hypothetical protein